MKTIRAASVCCAAVSTAVLCGCAHQSSPTSATGPVAPAATPAPAPAARAEHPMGAFTVTCHTGSGRTASGRTDGPGLASVDPGVVPLGTQVRVEKVGVVTAADKGNAVDGHTLDVWAPNTAACTQFGRQHLQVWRLG